MLKVLVAIDCIHLKGNTSRFISAEHQLTVI